MVFLHVSTFQCDPEMPDQTDKRQSRDDLDNSMVAYSCMVASDDENANRKTTAASEEEIGATASSCQKS